MPDAQIIPFPLPPSDNVVYLDVIRFDREREDEFWEQLEALIKLMEGGDDAA